MINWLASLLAVIASALPISFQDAPARDELGLKLRYGFTVKLRYELGPIEGIPRGIALQETRKTFEARLRALGVGGEAKIIAEPRPMIEVTIGGDDADRMQAIKQVLGSAGGLEFRLQVTADAGLDLEAERRRLDEQLRLHDQSAKSGVENQPSLEQRLQELTGDLLLDDGTRVEWVSLKELGNGEKDGYTLLRVEKNEALRFDESDVASFRRDREPSSGLLAIGLTMRPESSDLLRKFTGDHLGESLAVVFDGKVIVRAVIQDALPGVGIISGGARGFDQKELDTYLAILSAPRLPQAPVLIQELHVRK